MAIQERLSASDPEKAAVVCKGALRAAEYLKISKRALGQIIGLSEASISRLPQGSFRLDTNGKPFELALLFIRMFRSLDAITGGDQNAAASWLRSENTVLGAKPLDLIVHIPGLIDVIAYLDARRAIV